MTHGEWMQWHDGQMKKMWEFHDKWIGRYKRLCNFQTAAILFLCGAHVFRTLAGSAAPKNVDVVVPAAGSGHYEATTQADGSTLYTWTTEPPKCP